MEDIKKLRKKADQLSQLILEACELRGQLTKLDNARDLAVDNPVLLEKIEVEIKKTEYRLAQISQTLRKFGIDLA